MRRHVLVRFRMLSAAERAVVVRAVAALLIVRPCVAVFGVASVMRWLGHTHRPHQTDQTDPTHQTYQTYQTYQTHQLEPDRIVWLVEAAATHLRLPATCLTRSIVAAWLLGRSGRAATLSIGVRTDAPDDFAAHAWVSHNGRPLGPTVSENYTPLSITTINASATSP
jgi:hypothetical protein